MISCGKIYKVFICFILLQLVTTVVSAKDEDPHHAAKHAAGFSVGWISGSGVTYRRYFGDHFLQGTFVGTVSNSANDAYLNTAISGGTYLHKLKASGIIPPLGLKLMAGVDVVMERRLETRIESEDKISGSVTTTEVKTNEDKSYIGGGIGLDIGNPAKAGLTVWIAVNYVAAFDGLTLNDFKWFGARPAAGILYGW